MGFLIENAETRASLQSAFDHLFRKYGRDFDDDDEINLEDLSITKVGGHVGLDRPRLFGSIYRRSRDGATASDMLDDFDDPLLEKEEEEENYDDVFVRLSGRVKEAQLRSLGAPAVLSPRRLGPGRRLRPIEEILEECSIPDSPVVRKRRKRQDTAAAPQHDGATRGPSRSVAEEFDDRLWELVSAAGPVGLCSCRGKQCFDCVLLALIF